MSNNNEKKATHKFDKENSLNLAQLVRKSIKSGYPEAGITEPLGGLYWKKIRVRVERGFVYLQRPLPTGASANWARIAIFNEKGTDCLLEFFDDDAEGRAEKWIKRAEGTLPYCLKIANAIADDEKKTYSPPVPAVFPEPVPLTNDELAANEKERERLRVEWEKVNSELYTQERRMYVFPTREEKAKADEILKLLLCFPNLKKLNPKISFTANGTVISRRDETQPGKGNKSIPLLRISLYDKNFKDCDLEVKSRGWKIYSTGVSLTECFKQADLISSTLCT